MISGFRASDIGQYGIEDFSWTSGGGISAPTRFDIVTGESPFWDTPFDDVWPSVLASVGGYRAPRATVLAFPTRASLPEVRPDVGEPAVLHPTPAGSESVVSQVEPTRIFVPPPSILDEVPDYPYGSIPPIPDDVDDVAIDWGTLAGTVLSSYVGARYAPSPVRGIVAAQPSQYGIINQSTTPPAAAPAGVVMQGAGCETCPTGSPRYSKICNATGEITPFRRRRRRRLLTSGDLNDIAALKAIVGGGAALNAAVVKAMK